MTEIIMGGRIESADTSRLSRNDDRYRTVAIDRSTHAQTTIDYEHHEVHAGSHYYMFLSAILASGDTQSFGLVTPDTTRRMHMMFHISSADLITYTVTEGGVLAGGAAATIFNSRREYQVSKPSTCVGTVGKTGANPITMAGGTIIWQEYLSVGLKQGGVTIRAEEVILKPNTQYLFQVLSGANGNNESHRLTWYEHTDKD